MSIASEAIRRRNGRVDRYRQLVRPIALHYYARCAEPLDDLIQVGLMGLLRAAELFSDQAATPFDAFARPHIRGAILHYLRDHSQPIRLSRRVQEQLDQRRRALAATRLNDAQLCQAMGLSESQWQRLEQARRLNQLQPLTSELEDSLGAPVSDDQRDPGRDGLAEQALARLDPTLADVVRQVVLAGWSYRRTASQLCVSPMTVQRRLHKGLAVLREQLEISSGGTLRPVASGSPAC